MWVVYTRVLPQIRSLFGLCNLEKGRNLGLPAYVPKDANRCQSHRFGFLPSNSSEFLTEIVNATV